jgi:GT2 family glycosyltransferase
MSVDGGVLILLVATNGSRWLPDVIAGIRSQDYPDIDVVAIDNASTDSSRRMLEDAFGAAKVVGLDRRVGFGRALAAGLKGAGARASKAGSFLILHDDTALEPDAVSVLVEALGFEEVGVVGPKLVEWEDPDKLQMVGLTIDRYGRTFNPLERGEVDQGQHDRARDVLWVTSACMLVSRQAVETVGLFDLRYVTYRDDLDFCWRARLAGFRVVYAGPARARHYGAAARNERVGPSHNRARYFIERNLLTTLIKNYSLVRLLLVLPGAFIAALANAILLAFTGRRRQAFHVLEALQWTIVHLPGTLRARRRAQKARVLTDAEVLKGTVRGAHRVRSLAERVFERIAGEPVSGLDEAAEEISAEAARRPRLLDRIREHPLATAGIVLAIVYVVGTRTLWRAGPIAGADMPPFPGGPADFFREFFSGWRSGGAGEAAPANPALFLAGLLSIVTFGSAWLAQRIVLIALPVLAAATAARFARTLGCGVAASRVASLTYAFSPLALAALGQGRIVELALIATAPGFLVPIARAAGLASWRGWRDVAVPAIGLALVAGFSPWAIPFTAFAGALIALGSLAAGRRREAGRAALAGAAMAAAALAVLVPWSVELFRPGTPLGVGGRIFGVEAGDLIRLLAGMPTVIPVVVATAFPVAALAGFIITPADRSPAARVLAVAGIAAVGVAWAVSRGVWTIAPRPALPLTLAAIAMAVLAGFGTDAAVATLRARSFGVAHLALGLAAVGLLAGLGSGLGWVAAGTRNGIVSANTLQPSFFVRDATRAGAFRVLWLSGKTTQVEASLTGPTGDDFTAYAQRRQGAGTAALERVLAGVGGGTVDEAGRQLAPFGVRYVVLRPEAAASLSGAVARQADLRFVQRFGGGQIYANDSWIPVAASVAARGWLPAANVTPERAPAVLAGAEPDPQRGKGFRTTLPGILDGEVHAKAKAVLAGVTFDEGWRLSTVAGTELEPQRSFGWATAFPSPLGGPARIAWKGQTRHRLALLDQILIIAIAAIAWSRRASLERGER